MSSDESHVNDVSLTVRVKVTRQCPQTTTFEDKGYIHLADWTLSAAAIEKNKKKKKRSESRSGFEPRSLSVLTSLTPPYR